jgi:hypothetical protein
MGRALPGGWNITAPPPNTTSQRGLAEERAKGGSSRFGVGGAEPDHSTEIATITSACEEQGGQFSENQDWPFPAVPSWFSTG